jgi:hypothetical protein
MPHSDPNEAPLRCDEAPMTPLEGKLALLSETFLRAAISRLASKIPDGLYFTGGMDPMGRDIDSCGGVTTALFLLASRGAEEINAGHQMSQTFEGLENSGEPGGAELELETYDKEIIRAALSRLSKETRQSLYVDEGFSKDLGTKELKDGSILKSVGQAGLYLCSSLNECLSQGETWAIDFIALTHGQTSARAWRVSVERLTE